MPKIISKFIKAKRQSEKQAIRKMYKTGEYSIRDLMVLCKRSQKFVYSALVDKSLDK